MVVARDERRALVDRRLQEPGFAEERARGAARGGRAAARGALRRRRRLRPVEEGREPALPVQAFEQAVLFLHAVEPLVHLVEVRDQRVHGARAIEARGRHGDLGLPLLVEVAGIDEAVLAEARDAARPEAVRECLHLCVDVGEGVVDRCLVPVVGAAVVARAELGNDVGILRAAGTQRAGGLGQQHAVAAQRRSNRQDVEAGRPAAGHEHALARIDPLVDRDLLDGLDHGLAGEGEDRRGGLLHRLAQRLRQRRDGTAGGIHVERHAPAEEGVGVDVAEHHGGIGHGRRIAAPGVAGGAGVGAGALRPDAEQPARIDPGDGAAARAHASDIHRGEAEIVAGEEPTQPRFAGVLDRAVAHHAHVEGGAAGIHHQHVAPEPFGLGIGDAGERGHRRARLDHEDRPVGDVLDMHQAAGDRADQQLAGEARGAEVVAERAQMALHEGLQRGIDRGRGRARIFAQDRVEAVRERVGHPRHRLLDQGAQPLLVRRVLDRPEQADGDRLHDPLPSEAGRAPRAPRPRRAPARSRLRPSPARGSRR